MSGQLMLPGCEITATGLTLDEGITPEVCIDIGKGLALMEGACQWCIGDWLKQTDRYLGGEAGRRARCETVGLVYNTARSYVTVCESIEFARRRAISFEHHRGVSAIPDPDVQDAWLDEASREGWTRGKLRAEIRRRSFAERADEGVDGKFTVIYTDPPWESLAAASHKDEYGHIESLHYPTLTVEQIADLKVDGRPVVDLAMDDAVLFIWVVSSYLDRFWPVLEAWGFEYKTSYIWDKVKHSYGNYNSIRHELLLLCTRGSAQPPSGVLHDSVVTQERGEHSAKPEAFRQIIDELYPQGRRIELFARGELPANWKGWGNEHQAG